MQHEKQYFVIEEPEKIMNNKNSPQYGLSEKKFLYTKKFMLILL